MTPFLSKTISVKQLLLFTGGILILLTVLWFWLFISSAWRMKMGGVVSQSSPYFSSIPTECQGYAGRSRGGHTNASVTDILLLKYRVHRGSIMQTNSPLGLLSPCLGYAVLAGAHAMPPQDADFTEIFTDTYGEAVLEVRVQYFKNVNQNTKGAPK